MTFERLLIATVLAVVCSCTAAFAQDTTVFGSDNPNLAGRADGYSCCSGDEVPTESPALVTGEIVEPCSTLRITASGRVSFTPTIPTGNNPDGDEAFSMTNFGDGISAPKNVRANALVGVFLDREDPTGKATPPQLDFGTGLGFTGVSPGQRQIFFIGDGRTTDSALGESNGPIQEILVPAGATRLFLGAADGTGWYNNAGSFNVVVERIPYQYPYACGDVAGPEGVSASDSLAILKGAVGSQQCLQCECDVDHSGFVVTGDALRVLRYAVGQDVTLECPCCEFA